MNIKNILAKLVEKITGKKCTRCRHNCGGTCAHPSDDMFMRCWHGITRPGFEERTAEAEELTDEQQYQLRKIQETLQEAGDTARDGGLLNDITPDTETVDVRKALEWLEGYTITDTEKVYTNGTVLVPLFRVEQALEDKAYNGLREG